MEATFDELLVKSQKEGKSKMIKRILNSFFIRFITKRKNRLVKKFQFNVKIRKLKYDLKKTNKLFKQSLTDPTIDSVELGVKAMRIERELKMTRQIYRQLFYNRILLFFIKLFTKNS